MRVTMILEFRLVFVSRVSLENLKSHDKQTWVKDVIGVLSYVNEVRGHVELLLCQLP